MDLNSRSSLIKVAKLYYYGHLSQDQIAGVMGISRPKVSRMLTKARELKIVQVVISDSPLLKEEMEEKLREHLNLSSVRIVPSGATILQSQQNAGRAAVEYLNSKLYNGIYIGVAWGTTMDCTVSQFSVTRPINNATVVQLAGGMQSATFNIDSRKLALSLAQKLNSNFSLLQAPMLVSSKNARDVLLNEPEFKTHFSLFEKLDIALVGIGSSLPEQSVPYKAGYLSLEQSRELVRDGFATDICGNRIYKDGSIKPNHLTDRVISIPLEQIQKIPEVIGVAVGKDKALSITAAAKGGFIKTLITDEISAISILGLKNYQ